VVALGAFLSTGRAPLSRRRRRPYLGTPAAIPGDIAAGNFDSGGEGVAYDTRRAIAAVVNAAETWTSRAASEGGYDVGWTQAENG
jgi:hypothetical protein